MITFNKQGKQQLINLCKTRNICLEGNIIRVIDYSGDTEFEQYIKTCLEKDKEMRKKRLEITKQVQSKNNELESLNNENQRILEELTESLKSVEESKIQYEVQNKELILWKEENEKISLELQQEMLKSEQARVNAENAKRMAEDDLDVLQKRTQTQLIERIVKVSLGVIITVGLITTIMYGIALFTEKDTQIIGSTWANMFGILLTNAFSIIGTIMGVKYASKETE
jgi:predicted RNase H-like nuclease (RuvC/YqgF family)